MSSFGFCQFTFCSITVQPYNPVGLAHVIMKKHTLKFIKPILTRVVRWWHQSCIQAMEQVQAPPQTFCFTTFSVPFEHLLLGGVTRCLQS